MIIINFKNFTTAKVDVGFLKGVFKKTLRELGLKKEVEVALVLVGENRIKSLNKKYRGKNKVTDVLAFGYNDAIEKPRKSVLELGDIVICLPRAKKQAKKQEHSLKKELVILIIHGVLHLLGYEHETSSVETEKMEKKEKEVLDKII